MAAPNASVTNPWKQDAAFDLAFGPLAQFNNDITAPSSPVYPGAPNRDPFIAKLRRVDKLMVRRRIEKRRVLLERLHSDTLKNFDEKLNEIGLVCNSLLDVFVQFQQFEKRCNIQGGSNDAMHLSMTPDVQKKVVELLEFSRLTVQSDVAVEALQEEVDSNIRNMISGMTDRSTRLLDLTRRLEELEELRSAVVHHCSR